MTLRRQYAVWSVDGSPLVEKGDSGGVFVNIANAVVGMCVAAEHNDEYGPFALMTPLSTILRTFNLETP